MQKTLTYEQFYQKSTGGATLQPFNVYRLEEFVGSDKPMPYSRKDYYKISMISGGGTVHYADKTLLVEQNMLLFANPQIPYNWAPLPENTHGAFCIFTKDFFHGFGNVLTYPVFQPDGMPILSLADEEMSRIMEVFTKMFNEIATSYEYKYDVMRHLTMELVHLAMKMKPASVLPAQRGEHAAKDRITSIFLELLERQFPIESPYQRIGLKTPAEYAEQLNVHINHLNKVLKTTTGKTTSEVLKERISQEARALLKHTNWSISEISYCLGFEDPSHFIKFFKKNNAHTPRDFRDH